MNKFKEWEKREYSEKQRIIAFICEGIFFLLIYPFFIVAASTGIDRWLHLPGFNAGAVNLILGLLFVLGGLSLGWWSVGTQITLGSGTPVPVIPTKRLIVQGPFKYCRNPMTLGTFIASLGVCFWIGSFSALGIVLILMALLVLYIKRIEEKELAARFGSGYLKYKKNTPFMLPRLRRRP